MQSKKKKKKLQNIDYKPDNELYAAVMNKDPAPVD